LFIGHFGIAFLLIVLFPHVPVWVPLVAVSFPDLLWAILIWAGKEEVIIDKNNSLQSAIVFKKYPYSHSLLLTNLISLMVGAVLAAGLQNLNVIPVFVVGSASHWLLDTVVHLRDLPVLGFDGDRKVGLGLWKRGVVAFFVELFTFVAFAVLFVGPSSLWVVLTVGVVFHATNANSFFGSRRKSLFGSPTLYAGAALVGFAAVSAIYSIVL
jgi:hypothetical protein